MYKHVSPNLPEGDTYKVPKFFECSLTLRSHVAETDIGFPATGAPPSMAEHP